MRLSEYANFDGLGLAHLVRKKEISRRELAQVALRAIHAANPALNAIIETYDPGGPVVADDESDAMAAFAGVPFLLKDIGSHDANVTFELGSRLAKGLRVESRANTRRLFRRISRRCSGRHRAPRARKRCGGVDPLARCLLRSVRPETQQKPEPARTGCGIGRERPCRGARRHTQRA
jgi:hypothetical protein